MTKLSGYEAIDYAEANGLTLSKYTDPIEDAREGLTPDEARKIAADDPSLIHVEAVTTRHDGGLNDPLSLSAQAPTGVCEGCGKTFARSELATHGTILACDGCADWADSEAARMEA